ncbi:FMRFamide receptor-like [Babylonia areolata]|uniref:FMRFamide receptor-like n=1 Tax=Babylonia areolata TaxID=304850 RepID=UPI003FD3DF36
MSASPRSITEPSDTNTTSLSLEAPSEDVLLLQRVGSAIDFWVPPFLIGIGTFTNALVVMVMRSKHFRHMSTSFYMAVSAVVDTVSLLVPLPPHYLYVNFPHIFDSVRHVHVICSICHVTGWVSSNLGVFLTVAMTIDRSLAIQFPLKAPTLCTVRRAKIVTVCLLLLVILMVRSAGEVYRIFHDHYWPNIHNVSLVVSFAAIIIGNIIIILHVKRSEDSKELGEGAKNAGGSQSKKMSSKSRQLSVMLIIDSASIITCTMPQTIYMMLDQSFQSTELSDFTPYDIAKRNLVFAVSLYLIQVNHCMNFFLYCLSGARFRKVLKEVMCQNSQQNKHSSRSSMSVTSVHPRSQPKE